MNNSSNITKTLARLARDDINIFNAHKESDGTWVIEYEYGWNPTEYKTKWTKAVFIVPSDTTELGQALEQVRAQVYYIREELKR